MTVLRLYPDAVDIYPTIICIRWIQNRLVQDKKIIASYDQIGCIEFQGEILVSLITLKHFRTQMLAVNVKPKLMRYSAAHGNTHRHTKSIITTASDISLEINDSCTLLAPFLRMRRPNRHSQMLPVFVFCIMRNIVRVCFLEFCTCIILQTNLNAAAKKTVAVRAERPDDILLQMGDLPVDYVKYDVEGAEREALLGSAALIRRHRPELLVSAYHRSEDLLILPPLLRELCGDGYRFYLRRFPYLPAWDLNLYAIPDERA